MLFSWYLQNGSQNFDFFSIAMGADHSFYVKTLETHARAFLPALNISAVCSVLIFYAISLNLDSHAVTDTTKASLLQSGI